MPEYPGQVIYPETGYDLPPPPTTPPMQPPGGVFTCRYCGRGFSSAGALRQHMPRCSKKPIVEPEEEVFPCPYCGEEFGTAGALTMHKVRCPLNPVNIVEEGINTCEYCGQEFPTVDALATHIVDCPFNPANTGEGGEPLPPAVMPPVGTPEWAAWIEETTGQPQAGYMAGLGMYGQAYQTPYQQYQAGMYDPLSFLWQMQAPMEMAGHQGYQPTQYLSQFGPQYAQNPFAMYAMAQSTLGDVFGMTPEQRAGIPGAEYGGGLAQLLGLGLRQQLGPGAGWLQGRIPAERTQWRAQYPQQQGPSFLDYIIQKYNLGQYF